MSKVEEVARALAEASSEVGPDVGGHFEHLAHAAIEAMTEPTEAMIEAGVRADYGKTLGSRVANSHRAMCRAALSENQ